MNKDPVPSRVSELIALIAIVTVTGAAAVVAFGFPARARIYPVVVSLAAVTIALASIAVLRGAKSDVDAIISDRVSDDLPRILPYVLGFVGYYGAVAIVGLVTGSVMFVTLFLGKYGRVRWRFAIVLGLAVGAGLAVVGTVLNLRWPPSVIDPFVMMGLI